MARGWESKAIEAQQAEATEATRKYHAPLSPEQQALQRQLEGLELSRKNLQHKLETATNSRYQKMLSESIADLEQRIQQLSSKRA